VTTAKPFTIPKRLVYEAFEAVKANAGSAGVDKETIEDFETNLKDNLYRIWNRMSSGSYVPPPVKAVAIPKKTGGERILGVPTVADRVAQMVVKQMLEPDLEPIFLPDSYGYRPGKSALDAVAVTRERCWRYDWVLEFDNSVASTRGWNLGGTHQGDAAGWRRQPHPRQSLLALRVRRLDDADVPGRALVSVR
jgi:RNA-directed DNA polymerase